MGYKRNGAPFARNFAPPDLICESVARLPFCFIQISRGTDFKLINMTWEE